MSELIENIDVTIDDAPVATVPLVDNLTADNAAPKASTVGAALALKADAATIMENVTISVDGQDSDSQGVILLYGDQIPTESGSNKPTITEKIAAVEENLYADQIPMDALDSTKISEAIAAADGKTAADILYASGSTDKISDKVGGIDTRLATVEGKYLKDETQELTNKAAVRTNLGLGDAATYGAANNLTTSTAGNSLLDAAQGYALNQVLASLDSNFSSLWRTVSYEFSYDNLSAGSTASFNTTDLQMNPIEGYTPVAVTSIVTGALHVICTRFNLIGGTNYTLTLKNTDSSSRSGTGSITVLYLRTAAKYTEG